MFASVPERSPTTEEWADKWIKGEAIADDADDEPKH
jgi:hypothetical protein